MMGKEWERTIDKRFIHTHTHTRLDKKKESTCKNHFMLLIILNIKMNNFNIYYSPMCDFTKFILASYEMLTYQSINRSKHLAWILFRNE